MPIVEMNIKCLLGYHNWRFGYNHGIPLGTKLSYSEALNMLGDGRAYQVDECTRCPKQSRLVDGKRVILSRSEVEAP